MNRETERVCEEILSRTIFQNDEPVKKMTVPMRFIKLLAASDLKSFEEVSFTTILGNTIIAKRTGNAETIAIDFYVMEEK